MDTTTNNRRRMSILTDFGFCGVKGFVDSLLTPKYALLFTLLGSIGSFAESYFGMSGIALMLLVILINLELVTGLWAATVRKRKIVSKKLQRFLLKMMIYFILILTFHTLSKESEDFTKEIYHYMYTFTILYFIFVHVKSILENYARITGKRLDFGNYIKRFSSLFGSKTKEKK